MTCTIEEAQRIILSDLAGCNNNVKAYRVRAAQQLLRIAAGDTSLADEIHATAEVSTVENNYATADLVARGTMAAPESRKRRRTDEDDERDEELRVLRAQVYASYGMLQTANQQLAAERATHAEQLAAERATHAEQLAVERHSLNTRTAATHGPARCRTSHARRHRHRTQRRSHRTSRNTGPARSIQQHHSNNTNPAPQRTSRHQHVPIRSR